MQAWLRPLAGEPLKARRTPEQQAAHDRYMAVREQRKREYLLKKWERFVAVVNNMQAG